MDVFISSGTWPVWKDKLIICMIGSANSNISLIIFLDKLSYPALFVFVVRKISITSALVTGSKKNEVGVLYLIYMIVGQYLL